MKRQFTTFELDGNLLGIDVLLVREINRGQDVTKVHPAPDYVTGLMNLRGQVVTLIDAGIRLETGRRDMNAKNTCIILKTSTELEDAKRGGMVQENTSKDAVGLVVDAIGDMITVDEKEIESPPANIGGVDQNYIKGIIKLENRLMVLVKLEKLLEMQEGK
jgi:purine-binding chemotaxis protein CheW